MSLPTVYVLIMQLREEVGHHWAQRIRDGLGDACDVSYWHRQSPCTCLGALEEDGNQVSLVIIGDPFRFNEEDQRRLGNWLKTPQSEHMAFFVGELPPLLVELDGKAIPTTSDQLAADVAEALDVLLAQKGA